MEVLERTMLIRKITEWQKKSRDETDPFNKYISIFISYNIFYNLLEKTENPQADLKYGDRQRSVGPIRLLSDEDNKRLLNSLNPMLVKYLKIIPIYNEEYWKTELGTKIPISKELKNAYNKKNAKDTIDLLLKWLYSVRCNLVHGDKMYYDKNQKKLLEMSSNLLNILLETLMNNYCSKYVSK